MTDFLKKIGHLIPRYRSERLSVAVFTFWSAVFLMLGNAATAQSGALSAAELAAIEVQQPRAIAVLATIDAKIDCFKKHDAQYEKRSRKLELETGDLRRAEAKLQVELTVASDEERGFAKQVAETKRNLSSTKQKITRLNARLKSANAALKDCKNKLWIFGFTCDIAGEISGLNSDIRNMQAQRQAEQIKFSSATTQHVAASASRVAASESHSAAKVALQQKQKSIAENEAELKAIKSALSAMRAAKQGYATKQSSLASAYQDFKALDPSSDRRFEIRQLRNASQEMATALPIAEAVVDDKGLRLASGKYICAK